MPLWNFQQFSFEMILVNGLAHSADLSGANQNGQLIKVILVKPQDLSLEDLPFSLEIFGQIRLFH